MRAVGAYLWGKVDDPILKISSSFSGGVGRSHLSICGALSGGLILIGAACGRTRLEDDEDTCMELSRRYLAAFEEQFGTTQCPNLLGVTYGSVVGKPCSLLVEQAARLLLDLLEQAGFKPAP